MYIYHALINALSAHMIHIILNLNMILIFSERIKTCWLYKNNAFTNW